MSTKMDHIKVLKFYERQGSFSVQRVGRGGDDFEVLKEGHIVTNGSIPYSSEPTKMEFENYVFDGCTVTSWFKTAENIAGLSYYITYRSAYEKKGA